MSTRWVLDMKAEPVVPAWTSIAACQTNGAELQHAIINGFSENGQEDKEFSFEKVFTFKEHGEFFRGAATLAVLRCTKDFYDLLQHYGTIKVSIVKNQRDLL